MATFQSVFIPSSPVASKTLFTGVIGAGGTASITLGQEVIFAVTANADCNIRFGNATVAPTATVGDFPVWGGVVQEWDTGSEFDRISLFSTSGGTYWVYVLSRT